jgi:hypothetical protein
MNNKEFILKSYRRDIAEMQKTVDANKEQMQRHIAGAEYEHDYVRIAAYAQESKELLAKIKLLSELIRDIEQI